MAILDRIDANRIRSRVDTTGSGPLSVLLDLDVAVPGVEKLVREVRVEIADEVWAWFREHEHEPLVEFGLRWWKPVKIPLSQARWVVEAIAGPEPDGGS